MPTLALNRNGSDLNRQELSEHYILGCLGNRGFRITCGHRTTKTANKNDAEFLRHLHLQDELAGQNYKLVVLVHARYPELWKLTQENLKF